MPERACNERDCRGPECHRSWCAAYWSKRHAGIRLTEALRIGTPLEDVPGWSNWKVRT